MLGFSWIIRGEPQRLANCKMRDRNGDSGGTKAAKMATAESEAANRRKQLMLITTPGVVEGCGKDVIGCARSAATKEQTDEGKRKSLR